MNSDHVGDLYWTAGTCFGRGRSFYWFGSDTSMQFTNWRCEEPNNAAGNEDCVMIYGANSDHVYKWNDDPANRDRYYICEI